MLINGLLDLYINEKSLNDELQIRYKIENDKYKIEKEKNKKQDTEINKLKKQLQNISDEFLKYDWKNSTNEQIYNQLKSLYESIFMKENK